MSEGHCGGATVEDEECTIPQINWMTTVCSKKEPIAEPKGCRCAPFKAASFTIAAADALLCALPC